MISQLQEAPMYYRIALSSLVALVLGAAVMTAAAVSPQQADAFARKVAIITQQGTLAPRAVGARRTPVTEAEVNSWFAYRAQPLLPQGMREPQLTIIGEGKVSGTAMLDLEAVGKSRRTGGLIDPWALLGGQLPVTVTGVLHTQNGQGRFELQQASVSGVPIPKTFLQELVSYYSRTPEDPSGVNLDESFNLPAKIRQIEVGQGQAVVVQ